MPVSGSVTERNMTLHMTGEVDHHQAKRLMQEVDRRIDLALPKRLTLDLSGVTFMDSSGIAVLLRIWRKMRELDGAMQVIGVPEQPSKVLRAAGLERIIPIRREA